jgi:hypothetical protein
MTSGGRADVLLGFAIVCKGLEFTSAKELLTNDELSRWVYSNVAPLRCGSSGDRVRRLELCFCMMSTPSIRAARARWVVVACRVGLTRPM